MTPVLVVAYYFPPLGGAGTQRFAKFAKLLPECGYRPVVVTGDHTSTASAPEADSTLNDQIGPETVVTRLRTTRPLPMTRRLALRAKFRTDEDEWSYSAIPCAVDRAREENARAVITTLSPFSNWRVGQAVRQAADIPWILDLRDPWTLDGWRTFPSPLHLWRDLATMRRALRGADAVIANTPGARRAFIDVAGLDPDRVWTISNGFDPDDFAGHATPERSDRFRLVHVGTLHPATPPPARGPLGALRASARRIDFTGRSGRYLLEATGILRQRRPDLANVLSIELYGRADPSHRDQATRLGIDDLLTEHGYVAHRAATAAMTEADALFVPLHAGLDSHEELIVPGKLYECLASERPVLASIPEGDAATLIRTSGGGVVTPPDDATAIAAALERLIDAWQGGSPVHGAARSDLAPFTRRRLTERLADCLDTTIEGRARTHDDDPWTELRAAVAQRTPVTA